LRGSETAVNCLKQLKLLNETPQYIKNTEESTNNCYALRYENGCRILNNANDNVENGDIDNDDYDLVDKCFVILELGKIKKVTCIDDGVQVQKDVYHVNVTTPIGETILLTA
jgi:hypothetical protein